MAGYDLELLKLFFASDVSVLLVGDPRQVTYLTHIERKHWKYRNGKIRDFIENELGTRIKCNIDESTLMQSYRCNQAICQYSSRLYPNLPETKSCSCDGQDEAMHQGVYLIKTSQIDKYIDTYIVMQLRWDRRTEVQGSMPVMNFGESKGETFERVLIYPTMVMAKWVKNNDTSLSEEARAKLYVGLTRARYSAAIVMDYDEDNIDGVEKWDERE